MCRKQTGWMTHIIMHIMQRTFRFRLAMYWRGVFYTEYFLFSISNKMNVLAQERNRKRRIQFLSCVKPYMKTSQQQVHAFLYWGVFTHWGVFLCAGLFSVPKPPLALLTDLFNSSNVAFNHLWAKTGITLQSIWKSFSTTILIRLNTKSIGVMIFSTWKVRVRDMLKT